MYVCTIRAPASQAEGRGIEPGLVRLSFSEFICSIFTMTFSVKENIGMKPDTSKQFNDMCEVPKTHWARVGTTAPRSPNARLWYDDISDGKCSGGLVRTFFDWAALVWTPDMHVFICNLFTFINLRNTVRKLERRKFGRRTFLLRVKSPNCVG